MDIFSVSAPSGRLHSKYLLAYAYAQAVLPNAVFNHPNLFLYPGFLLEKQNDLLS